MEFGYHERTTRPRNEGQPVNASFDAPDVYGLAAPLVRKYASEVGRLSTKELASS